MAENDHWTCGGCGFEGNGPDNHEWREHVKVCPAEQKSEPAFEVADFHPGTSHKHDCPKTRVSSGADCTENCIHDLYAVAEDQARVIARLRNEQDEVDRAARAYGWEIRNKFPLSGPKEQVTFNDKNPFLHADWRKRAGLE